MLVIDLRSPLARRPELTGSRAATLADLLHAGLPVPPGFIVTTQAQRAAAPPPAGQVADSGTEATAGARSAAAERPGGLPLSVDNALRAAYAAYPPGTTFAVRGSPRSPDEAPPAVLNCLGVEEVREGVAAAFRGAGGRPMAVLVQSMVHGELTGLAHSLDSESGRTDLVRVLAAYGLQLHQPGEADVYLVRKSDGVVCAQELGRKSSRLIAVRGGVRRESVDPQRAALACLSPERLRDLCELVGRIERQQGFPQSVRWAVARGRLYILGVRPLQALPPAWSASGLPAWVPRVREPLLWDLQAPLVHSAFDHALARTGAPPVGRPWLRRRGALVEADTALLALYTHRLQSAVPPGQPLSAALDWAEGLGVDWACAGQGSAAQPATALTLDPEAGPVPAWAAVTQFCQQAGDTLRFDAAIALAAHLGQALLQRRLNALDGRGAGHGVTLHALLAEPVDAPALQAREDAEIEVLSRLDPAWHADFATLLARVRRYARLDAAARERREALATALRRAVQRLGRQLQARHLLEEAGLLLYARRDTLEAALAADSEAAWAALRTVIEAETEAWESGGA